MEKEIVYANVDDVELELDLYKPAKGDGPFPAIVIMHGGNWVGGKRDSFSKQSEWAADRGYVAILIERRYALEVDENSQTKYPFPAPLHDAKCAVRWLRSNAEDLGIDPDRIGVVGFSDGGMLALLLALTGPSDGLEGECGDLNYSSRVQAAVNLGGDMDLAFGFDALPTTVQFGRSLLLGGTPEERPEEFRVASPITYVSEDDPPVLSIRGDIETEITPELSELFDTRMRDAGASHTLIMRELTTHSYFMRAHPELYITVFEFLDSHLKNDN